MKNTTLCTAMAAMLSSAAAYADPLEIDVYRTNPDSFEIASVLVTGDTEAVLIDAQFANSEAQKVVDMINASGKELTTIFISHNDPDFFFGLDVISTAFPDAEIYATAETADNIAGSWEGKLEFWGPVLGEDAPARIIIPETIPGNSLTVDGEELIIYGMGGETAATTHVWIPSIKAVVGGVAVMGDHHVFVADLNTTEKREARIALLETLLALDPEIVVPTHSTPAAPFTAESIQMTIDYLTFFEGASEEAQNSEELMAILTEEFPDFGCAICLDIGAKVTEGEMEWD